MKITPSYYTDWLTWAKEKALSLDGANRAAFLSEVWGVFEEITKEVERIRPITFRTALSLIGRRFDPLEGARNRMERIKNTYGPIA